MAFIKTCVRTLLTIAQKGAYCLSYVWFLLPIISLYVFKEICCNMDDNPAKTDLYLNTYLLIFLIFIIYTSFFNTLVIIPQIWYYSQSK